jgi:DNA-binding beta-propeller fold protein YncE
VVVDASGNSLLRVHEDGTISLLAVFPSRSTVPPRPTPGGVALTDSVPTSVVVGPDGAYYVGEVTGIPVSGPKRDKSNVYRVEAGQDPEHPTVFLDGHVTGFNAIIDMAFQGDDLYIVQHWTMAPDGTQRAGNLIRVACAGRPLVCDGLHPTIVLGGLDGPTALAFAPDGALYITNHGASPAFTSPTSAHTPLGEVLRIDLGDGDDHGHDHHDGDNDPHDPEER